MLELNQHTNTYHNPGDVPGEWSQGAFPFGMSCGTRLLAAQRKRQRQSSRS